MFNSTSLRLTMPALCLMIAAALCPAPATAQDTHEASSTNTTKPQKLFAFEVFSIRPHPPDVDRYGTEYLPNGYKITLSVADMIRLAYLSQNAWLWPSSKILNAPAWADKDWYDIDARVAPDDMAAWQQARNGSSSELLQSAMQAALKDRCNLALHITPIEVPYLDLVADKHGTKLKETAPGPIEPIKGKPNNRWGKSIYIEDNGQRQFRGISMEELTRLLMRLNSDYPIQDKTGLTGRYDFTLPWYDPRNYSSSEFPDPMDRMPLTSIGLTLKRGTGPAFLINIDHIEKPSPN